MRTNETTILDTLRRLGGRARAEQIAAAIGGISTRTVRRRLGDLETQGRVEKVGQDWRLSGRNPDKTDKTDTTITDISIKGAHGIPSLGQSRNKLGSDAPSVGNALGPAARALGPGLHPDYEREIHVLEYLANDKARRLAKADQTAGYKDRQPSRNRATVAALRELAATLNAGRHDGAFVEVWGTIREVYKQRMAEHMPDWTHWYNWAEDRVTGRRSKTRYTQDPRYAAIEIVGLADDDVEMHVPAAPGAAAGGDGPDYPDPTLDEINEALATLEAGA